MFRRNQVFVASLLALASFCLPLNAAPRPIPVKVVVVAMFEVGNDIGDAPGELQYWVERDHLDQVYPLPAGYHPVRMNKDGEMAMLTGQGTAHAAATIMAVGLDPRFDFSHAFWLIAGIAGGNPERVSLGSAAWAHWIVDGDLGYEIDPREMPRDWSTGYIPLRKTRPFETPAAPLEGQVYELNASLAQWAYDLTRATPLADPDSLKEIRAHFDGARRQVNKLGSHPWESSAKDFRVQRMAMAIETAPQPSRPAPVRRAMRLPPGRAFSASIHSVITAIQRTFIRPPTNRRHISGAQHPRHETP